MPAVKMAAKEYCMRDFMREIRAAAARKGLNEVNELADKAGISYKTMLKRVKEPETLKLPEIVALVWAMDMGADQLAVLCRKTVR